MDSSPFDRPVAVDEIFPRQSSSSTTCVDCPPASQLTCSTCPAGQKCQFIYPTVQDCSACPYATCIPTPTQTAAASSHYSPNVGGIAGGVIGGLAVVALLTYLGWRFCVKPRRRSYQTPAWAVEAENAGEAEMAFDAKRDQRASIRTRHSIASTVLTRASNIIQIAYIPGVTNRAAPTSPTLLVPPVPPIPIAVSQASTPNGTEEEHFFVPGDLRDSTYSALSGYTDRTSYARTSYAPRSSVASTIYGKSAVIVAPAQTGMRAKPAMVSVKSTSSGNSGALTPPVPSVDYQKYSGVPPVSPANSTFSVGSTFLNNASAATAMPARAQVVRLGSGGVKKVDVTRPASHDEPAGAPSPANSARRTPVPRDSNNTTIIEETPALDQGPFADPPSPSFKSHQSTNSLSKVIEEATRRASQKDTGGEAAARDASPFGDEHATKE